jgi:hypothetical protein
MKRRWFLLFGVFVAAVLVAGYFLIPVGEGRISQATCDKIPVGFRAEQLVHLLGDCDIGGSGFVLDVRDTDGKIDAFWQTSWADEDLNEIEVYFHNGRVSGKLFVPSQLSFLERIRNRIQRRLKAVWP